MPEGTHPLPHIEQDSATTRRGWKSVPPARFDGQAWPLGFARELLGITRPALLRELVLELGLQPAGTLNMREYHSQGRAARAYKAADLIAIGESIQDLKEKLSGSG